MRVIFPHHANTVIRGPETGRRNMLRIERADTVQDLDDRRQRQFGRVRRVGDVGV
ncbi:hypothetical protein RAA17_08835 [Komagataeibacter rhaeticus]|nr:hypothetical protein [Komagataeibacter rhaeticus]